MPQFEQSSNPQSTLRRMCVRTGWLPVLFACWQSAVHAGPPLISDDAQALGGAGLAELIVAATGLRQANFRQIDGPVVDMTFGLNQQLDATLVASVSRLRDAGANYNAALLCPGIKWQFVSGGAFNVSASPALMLDVNDADSAAALLPLQAEWVTGPLTLGVDAGHIQTRRGPNQWQAGSYAVWTASQAVVLLGELWAVSARPDKADRGWTLGADLGLPTGQRLLIGYGQGFDSGERPEVDHYGYLGVMTAFGN